MFRAAPTHTEGCLYSASADRMKNDTWSTWINNDVTNGRLRTCLLRTRMTGNHKCLVLHLHDILHVCKYTDHWYIHCCESLSWHIRLGVVITLVCTQRLYEITLWIMFPYVGPLLVCLLQMSCRGEQQVIKGQWNMCFIMKINILTHSLLSCMTDMNNRETVIYIILKCLISSAQIKDPKKPISGNLFGDFRRRKNSWPVT